MKKINYGTKKSWHKLKEQIKQKIMEKMILVPCTCGTLNM